MEDSYFLVLYSPDLWLPWSQQLCALLWWVAVVHIPLGSPVGLAENHYWSQSPQLVLEVWWLAHIFSNVCRSFSECLQITYVHIDWEHTQKRKFPGNCNPLVRYVFATQNQNIVYLMYINWKQRNGTNLYGTESATCSVWNTELRVFLPSFCVSSSIKTVHDCNGERHTTQNNLYFCHPIWKVNSEGVVEEFTKPSIRFLYISYK